MRRKIRKLIVWLMARTDKWVMPPEFYERVSHGELGVAIRIYDEQCDKWGFGDPVLVRASVLIRVKTQQLREQQERNR